MEGNNRQIQQHAQIPAPVTGQRGRIGTLTVDVVNKETVNAIRVTSDTILSRLNLQNDDSHFVIELIVLSAGECSCKKDYYGKKDFELYEWEIESAGGLSR
jgi:hypothetical protein